MDIENTDVTATTEDNIPVETEQPAEASVNCPVTEKKKKLSAELIPKIVVIALLYAVTAVLGGVGIAKSDSAREISSYKTGASHFRYDVESSIDLAEDAETYDYYYFSGKSYFDGYKKSAVNEMTETHKEIIDYYNDLSTLPEDAPDWLTDIKNAVDSVYSEYSEVYNDVLHDHETYYYSVKSALDDLHDLL